MQLTFDSELNALAVAEQLYNCDRIGETLIINDFDSQALELAIALTQSNDPSFKFPLVTGSKCRLPFPSYERECTGRNTPKIYVACLSAYNNGHLHGLYIDATQEPDEIQDDINWMLSWSPMADVEACEEWAIHDYENWGGINTNESEDIDKLASLAAILKKHGKAFAVYYNYYGNDVTAENFEEYYLGEYESEEDFVQEQWNEQGKLKELEKLGILQCYIDWKAIANDWFIDDYLSIEERYQEVHVFVRH
jgi:antirestriction protein